MGQIRDNERRMIKNGLETRGSKRIKISGKWILKRGEGNGGGGRERGIGQGKENEVRKRQRGS